MRFKSLSVVVVLVMLTSAGCRKKPAEYSVLVPPPPSSSNQQAGGLPVVYPPDMADGSSASAMGGRASSIFEPLPEVQPVYEPNQGPVVMTFDQSPVLPTSGPSQSTYTPPAHTPPSGSAITVSRGDTLWSLASRHYGNGQRWRDIAAANGINNERQLRVGQRLVIP